MKIYFTSTYLRPISQIGFFSIKQLRQSENNNIFITAELGRALAVVKVTYQVNGNTQFSGVCPPKKTIGAIKIKSGTYDYVGEGNPHAKFGNIVITGASPHRGEI